MGMLKRRAAGEEMARGRKAEKIGLGLAGEMDTVQWTDQLRQEIAEAHREWVNANRFFDVAEGQDQVDYAIYSIITAEKRYEMLLRVAKRTCQKWPEWRGTLR